MAKYSIILPVRNGGHYVKDCIASILAQSVPDFNLIVLDNNSTDGTVEWINSLGDPRVEIYLSEIPLGIEQNWGRIVTVPKNEFITLIGHDDLLHKDYLATMEALISKFPDASLYQTHFTYINANGEKIRSCKAMPEVESAEDFLKNFLRRETDVMGTGFMMRSGDYDSIGGIPFYPNLLFADFELWIKLAKTRYKATSSNECFSFRIHQSMTTNSPDAQFIQAFGQFIYFLRELMNEEEGFKKIIRKNATFFLEFYCRGLSHRLLRTPTARRKGVTVSEFVKQCKNYTKLLELDPAFNPAAKLSVRLAILLDRTALGRSLFLAFKKIVPQPILK